MPPRICVVTIIDSRGIRHSVEVTAESLFEAGVIAINTLRKVGWVEESPGPGTRLEIEVKEPSVIHHVTVAQLQSVGEWDGEVRRRGSDGIGSRDDALMAVTSASPPSTDAMSAIVRGSAFVSLGLVITAALVTPSVLVMVSVPWIVSPFLGMIGLISVIRWGIWHRRRAVGTITLSLASVVFLWMDAEQPFADPYRDSLPALARPVMADCGGHRHLDVLAYAVTTVRPSPSLSSAK